MSYRIIEVNSLIIVDCWTGCLDRYYQRQLLYIRETGRPVQFRCNSAS